jgi:hypothetical protein
MLQRITPGGMQKRLTIGGFSGLLILIGSACAHPASIIAPWTGPFPARVSVAPIPPGRSAILGVVRFVQRSDSARTRHCVHERTSFWIVRSVDSVNTAGELSFVGGPSDSTGVILLNGLTPGRSRLVIRGMGYEMIDRVIVLRPNQRDTFDVRLVRSSECGAVMGMQGRRLPH